MHPRFTYSPIPAQFTEAQENYLPAPLDVYNSSEVVYSNSFNNYENVDNKFEFSFFGQFYLSNITSQILFSIGDKFSFKVIAGNLVVEREIVSGIFELINTSISISVTTWTLIRICRKESLLSIKVDNLLVEIPFYYKIQSGIFKIGDFTGNVKNIGYKSIALPWLLSLNSDVFNTSLIDYKKSNNQICYFKYFDEVGNFTKLIDSAVNDYKLQTKLISANSLVIQSTLLTDSSFTIELRFLSLDIGSNVELLSYWESPNLSFFVRKVDNIFKFGKLNSGTIVLSDIGDFDSNSEIQVIKIEFNQFNIKLWLNGVQKLNTTVPIKIPSYKFWFNSSKYQAPTGNYQLVSFSVYENIVNLEEYYPQINQILPEAKVEQFYPIKFRNLVSSTFQGIFSRQKFILSGATSVLPNSTNTYTITQEGRYDTSTTYYLYILLPTLSDWQINEATLNTLSVSVAPNTLTATFQLNLSNFAKRPARTPFTIRVSNSTYYQDYVVELNDLRQFTITSVSGYIDGYFAKSSTISGTIPNLTATKTATTSSSLENSFLYGKTYKISNEGQKINLNTSIVGVKTLFFVYRELVPKSYRQYVGSVSSYTFNGGADTQLVGALQFDEGDYVKISTQAGRFSKVAIAENESNLVYIDDLANVVKVVRRVSGIWSFSNAITLSLNPNDAANLANASLQINNSGDLICIGLKNANLGEGRVLHFSRSGVATWTSTLTLGAPSPAPYSGGFGLSAFASDDNTKLLVSLQGENKMYLFTKSAGIYNTTPAIVFNFFGKKILGDFSLSRFVAQDNSGNLRIFDNNALTQVITGAELDVAFRNDYIAISKFDNSVEIWEYDLDEWVKIKTITSSVENFGYSLSFAADNYLLVGSPSESTSYLYSDSDNWNVPKSFVGTGLYGYSNALTENSVLVSNYTDNLEFYSSDGASIPQIISNARQNKAPVPLTTNLDSTDAQVLVFSSSSDLTVDSLASNVNGLFLGCLMYNRILSNAETQSIENEIYEYLGLKERSFYG